VVASAGQTIALPSGNYQTLNLLAAGLHGGQLNQRFVVTYTDGTTQSFVRSLSDWCTNSSYSGETVVASTSYRDTAAGGKNSAAPKVYGYSLNLNLSKTVASVTLPGNSNVVILGIGLLA
jgi:hypothetical protein